MKETLLSQLGLTASDTVALPGKVRNRILDFLIRWEAWQQAVNTLDLVNRPDLVSMSDRKAKALAGMGRTPSAIKVMSARLEQKFSATALSTLGRFYLEDGNTEMAQKTAERLIAQNEATIQAWSLLADVHLAEGRPDEAEKATREQIKLSPRSRAAALRLAKIYLAKEDRVQAQAFAVNAYTVNEGEYPLQTYMLQELRDFFDEIGDTNRLLLLDEMIPARFNTEIAEIITAIAESGQSDAAKRARTSPSLAPARLPKKQKPAPLPDLNLVNVSTAERQKIESAAKEFFGFDNLREAQVEIMACALRNEDVLAILPTGAGKSLTYQLPALLTEGVSLIVSPLIALMKDQVDGLPDEIRSKALAINSSLSESELKLAIRDVALGKYKMVFVAPERLRQWRFVQAIKRAGIGRLVIDEAHCLSTWGHDFRPDYLWVTQAHQALGAPPIIALTATAPLLVREDIERRLFSPLKATAQQNKGRKFQFIALDTFRDNLNLAAITAANADSKLTDVINLAQQLPSPGIIYARSRKNCEEIALILRGQGLNAEHYHAGIGNRTQVQNRFMNGETDIIVATVAFGMGIDKADIRFILHYGLPNSIESYYQEAGRAGRDGDEAWCVLVHSTADKGFLTRLVNNDALKIDFLRAVYGQIRNQVPVGRSGPVMLDTIAQRLQTNSTQLRVAVNMLENAGLLDRGFDVPLSMSLRWISAGPLELQAFAAEVGLEIGIPVTRNTVDIAAVLEVFPGEVQPLLSEWAVAGHLFYDGQNRVPSIRVLQPPADSSDRIERLLAENDSIQKQRVAEIGEYGKSRYCRHGYLANYLGGAVREKCDKCDNCKPDSLPSWDDQVLETDPEIERGILLALAENGWGKRNLVRLLTGDLHDNERALGSEAYSVLNGRGERIIQMGIKQLIDERLIEEKQLSHGGTALGITGKGRKKLLSGH
ncbi:MAG: ATP-dependent DNA helicase RecQ [Cellvibrionaceae bacterium]|jgi:ATP-dependent DNA helicase RecQ